jgi:hypothetical protein
VQLASLAYDSGGNIIPTMTSSFPTHINVLIYPNPMNNLLNLEINPTDPNSKGSYTIYGLVGNVILHKELIGITKNYNEVIDISSLAKGLYTIQVIINRATTVKKIIKN